ncbi:MAG TPA: response regulator transcription factor [Solimonas sp.]|nr:response regulator transcription factor [Solimonas sp.]
MARQRRVLLVDDDDDTRERLARAVAQVPGLSVCGSAGSCAEARRLALQQPPDLLLADLGLPDGSGADLIAELMQQQPALQALVITVFGDEAHVVRAIEAGATGYLLKDASAAEIDKAIRDLLDGGAPISPSVARHMLSRFRVAPRVVPEQAVPASPLTERETQVLSLVARGYSYAEIAESLVISVNTVGFHVKQIYRKLAVGSRSAALFEAMELGLLARPAGADERR